MRNTQHIACQVDSVQRDARVRMLIVIVCSVHGMHTLSHTE